MSQTSIKTVLVIEDNLGDARLLREMLNEQGWHDIELTHVSCMSEAQQYLAQHVADIILLDLGLPDAEGLDGVRRVRSAAPDVPLVVLTGLDDELLAAQALQEGAQDYLVKGQINMRGIMRALRYAVERKSVERLKDGFVASVSHELRTPLTSISGSLALLMVKAAGTLPVPLARLLEIAHANCQRLVRLVNDILDIEKMEAGQVAFDFLRIEVRSLVEQAIDANRGFAESCGVTIRLDEACSVCDVRADPDRLAQVVTNLLSNAIKFSPAESEVVVAIEKMADVARISVRDHGPGIPEHFKTRIFERFAQADTATNTQRKGGTGLGLSIVRQIITRLGGTVGFADAPGGGTIFHIELPCWEPAAAAVGAIDGDARSDVLRVLLCDDNPETAGALRRQLKTVGFALDIAYTAGDALKRATTAQYHAFLVDLKLPDADGITLILQLRELPGYRQTPIIVVSADPGPGRQDHRSSKLNVLDWLNKPVDFEHLMRILAKPAALDASRRPLILFVDGDNAAPDALEEMAEVVSINSIDEARRVVKDQDFDLVVINIARPTRFGPDLLHDLCNSNGHAVPVVVSSAEGDDLANDLRVPGTNESIAGLVATVRERLTAGARIASEVV